MSKRPGSLAYASLEGNKCHRINTISKISIDNQKHEQSESLFDMKDFIPCPTLNNQVYGNNNEVVDAITRTKEQFEEKNPFLKLCIAKICNMIVKLKYYSGSSITLCSLYQRHQS